MLGCAAEPPPPPPSDPVPASPPALETPAPEPVRAPRTVTLIAGGDVLPHRRVKASAAAGGWEPVLAGISERLRAADLAFANLESPVAPDAHQGVHGEVFDAPASLLDGLASAGFDVLSMANNHAWDQGVAGLLETHRRVRDAGMHPVGAGPTCADAQAPVIVEASGVRVAWLAAVDLLNLDLRAGDGDPCVHVAGPPCTGDCGPDRDALFFTADVPALTERVRQARAHADLVVVSFHWGDEYRTVPLPEYPPLAQALVDAGADLVLGHHPHVLQPIRRVTAADGRQAIVAYSLGNLVSDMGRTYTLERPVSRGDVRDGGLLAVTATFGPDGTVLEPVFHPTWTTNTDVDGVPAIAVRFLPDVPEDVRVVREARVREVLGPDVPIVP